MKITTLNFFPHRGFSLVEMAVVLAIVALLLGGSLSYLSSQQEYQNIQETETTLESIKEALIGYAAVNGRLPRPAESATDGTEQTLACVNEADCSGFIPWITLGVPKLDAWRKIIRYSVSRDFAGGATGNATITLATVATRKVQTRDGAGVFTYLIGSAGACAVAQCAPAVIFSHGRNNWGTSDSGTAIPEIPPNATNIDEDANNLAATVYIQRTRTTLAVAPGGIFDDQVDFLSPSILVNRMISAGRLP